MLMQTLLETYRDLTGQSAPRGGLTTVPVTQPAANANRWSDTASHQRRARRQRRLARTEPRSISGWSVRTW